MEEGERRRIRFLNYLDHKIKERGFDMNYPNYNLYHTYYKITVNGFYNAEQRRKLLRFLAGSIGINSESKGYAVLTNAVDTVDAQNITNLTDSMNYRMICGMLEEDEEIHSAALALSDVYEDMRISRKPTYKSYLDWMISLRTTYPKNNDIRAELACFEYANGNIADATSELKAMIDTGNMDALEQLAFICDETADYEESYYYYSFLKKVYTDELKIETPVYILEAIDRAEGMLDISTAHRIECDIRGRVAFLNADDGTMRNPIGFAKEGTRRYVYEH